MIRKIFKLFNIRSGKKSKLYINSEGKLCEGKIKKSRIVHGLDNKKGYIFKNGTDQIVNKLESNDGSKIDFGFNKKYVNTNLGW